MASRWFQWLFHNLDFSLAFHIEVVPVSANISPCFLRRWCLTSPYFWSLRRGWDAEPAKRSNFLRLRLIQNVENYKQNLQSSRNREQAKQYTPKRKELIRGKNCQNNDSLPLRQNTELLIDNQIIATSYAKSQANKWLTK